MIIQAPNFNKTGVSPGPAKAALGESVSASDAAIETSIRAAAWEQSPEGLRRAISAMNRAAKSLNAAVELSLDSQSGKAIVRVIDTETGQLIRQIPSVEMLELRRALDRVAGLLIQRTA